MISVDRYWSDGEEECGSASGALWEDPDFPAAAASLGDRRLAHRARWLRPHVSTAPPAPPPTAYSLFCAST